MFRRHCDNHRRPERPNPTNDFDTDRIPNCDEYRRSAAGHHRDRDAYDVGYGSDAAAEQHDWLHADASWHRHAASIDDGCRRGRRRSGASDFDDAAGDRHHHDDAHARQARDG
jgi:hypothetical protein